MPEFLGRKIANATFESITNQTGVRTINLRHVSSGSPAQYWRFVITLEPSRHDIPEASIGVFANVASYGRGEFEFPVPQPRIDDQMASRSARGSALSTTLSLSDATIKAGRFVSFSGHNKVYICLLYTSPSPRDS